MKKKSPPGKSPRPAAAPAKKRANDLTLPLPATAAPDGDAAAPNDHAAAPKQTLKIPEVLAELEGAAKSLNVRLTYEAIGGELGAGGLCKVKGQWRVIIDKRTTPSERVSVLAPALARFDFHGLALSPQVLDLLRRVAPPAESAAAPTAAATAAASPAEAATAAAMSAEASTSKAATSEAATSEASPATQEPEVDTPAAADETADPTAETAAGGAP